MVHSLFHTSVIAKETQPHLLSCQISDGWHQTKSVKSSLDFKLYHKPKLDLTQFSKLYPKPKLDLTQFRLQIVS